MLCKNVTLFSAFWEWHQTLGRTPQTSLLVDKPLSEKGCKMLIGLLARRWCKSPKTCIQLGMQRESLVLIRGLLTLHNFVLSIDLYVKSKVYKSFPDNRGWVSHWTGFPRVLFTLFSGWIPIWSGEAHHVYLLAPASKIHERGSPRWGTLRYSNGRQWPSVDGANLLSWGFISFPCKPSYSASFLQ